MALVLFDLIDYEAVPLRVMHFPGEGNATGATMLGQDTREANCCLLACSGPGYQDHSRFGQAGPLSSGIRDHPGSGKRDHVRSGKRDQSPW